MSRILFTGGCLLPDGGCACSRGVPGLGGGACSQGVVLAPGGCLFRGVPALEGVPGGDPPETATAAGGTHLTGMHSC